MGLTLRRSPDGELLSLIEESGRNVLRTTLLPRDLGDGHRLATALDDIVDHAEQVADTLGLYGVEATMEQAIELADVLVGASEQVAQALGRLRNGGELAPHLV